MSYFYNKLRKLAQAQGIDMQVIENTVSDTSAACDMYPENIAQALYLAMKAYPKENSATIEASNEKSNV